MNPISAKEKVYKCGLTAVCMRATGIKTRPVSLVDCCIRMVTSTRVNG